MNTIPLSWTQLATLTNFKLDRVNGDTNAQAKLRLFGQSESAVSVTLYRDHHAWCPYCQKIWLWLEEQQIPYRIEKVTMFCYGEKERWYKHKVPSGMLPAIDLKGKLITESDDILMALEREFGVLGKGMTDPVILPLRHLERLLFKAWCNWLCYQSILPHQERYHQNQFITIAQQVEESLSQMPGPYFLEDFSIADVIFIPYVERMNASLYYYKGFSLRNENPRIGQWLAALETRTTYRGTQSDFHTHVHDLPPQMGRCWSNNTPVALQNQRLVNQGPWNTLPDVVYPEPSTSCEEALSRVIRHRSTLIRLNPGDDAVVDGALRCALTWMMTGELCQPPSGADVALRYLRDRICVPRDMSIYAARRLREALEKTAALAGDGQGTPIPFNHRRDQNPIHFLSQPEGSTPTQFPQSHFISHT